MFNTNYLHRFATLILIMFATNIYADKLCSVDFKNDTSKIKSTKQNLKIHSPKKAAIMSAILPGLGQCYNKKYWKTPIIYAGLGTFGYFFVKNLKQYKIAAAEIRWRNDTAVDKSEWHTNNYNIGYSATDIQVTASQYRRYAELNAIGFLVFYTFQIVDAVVDAHLFTFDVSDNLSMKIEPTVLPQNKTFGINLTLGFK